MNEPTERKAIARIIYDETGILGQKCYGSQEAADRIIAEHIDPLRVHERTWSNAVHNMTHAVERANAAEARASALEALLSGVREALSVSVYDSRPLALYAKELVARASEFEALLAEAGELLEHRHHPATDGAVRSFLAKLEVRT